MGWLSFARASGCFPDDQTPSAPHNPGMNPNPRFNSLLALALAVVMGAAAYKISAAEPALNVAVLRAGTNFIATRVYSAAEDQSMLKAFEGLRVADVCDGMDAVGLPNRGLMDPAIHPLWRDTKHYTHRFVGIAVTARYVPTQEPAAGQRPVEDYDRWAGQWYQRISSEPFVPLLRPGSALVIDDTAEADVGSIGSNNIMSWKLRGCVGVVTGATARDTDEIITEKVPLYFRRAGRGIRPGRNEIESVNRPIAVGGVLVKPGDVIVADGDGVIVVPRAQARAVAAYAQKIIAGDKAGRRHLYEQLGLPEDPSVK
jgi:4-hydroxy-4-methyl-2-oxoglutarate aldolase